MRQKDFHPFIGAKMMNKTIHLVLIGFLTLSFIQTSNAQVCKPQDVASEKKQAAIKYLRRLSLDLRGRLPSYKEQLDTYNSGHVTDAVIDSMLKSNAFTQQMRSFFQDLLTLNINDLSLTQAVHVINYVKLTNSGAYAKAKDTSWIVIDRRNIPTRLLMRGANIGCLANEKAKYNTNGQLLCKLQGTNTYKPCIDLAKDRSGGTKVIAQEGYVEVRPFWDEDSARTWRVCGQVAYTHKDITVGKATYNCDLSKSSHDRGRYNRVFCGCGPELKWCVRAGEGASGISTWKTMRTEILESMMEQSLRFIDDVIENDKPYTDILLGQKAEVNGPLSHVYRESAGTKTRIDIASSKEVTVPSVPYYRPKVWKSFTMPARSAGILTLPFFTLKYATNRGRLHRYHNAFLCQYFSPPPGGLPDPTDACHNEPDLTQRCGCKSCHQTIEPEAAHWGRWQENAWFPLNPTAFPAYDKKCDTSVTKTGNPGYCRTLYMLNPGHTKEEKYRGKLLAYVFAPKSWENNIANGPTDLVKRDIANDKIASCGVKNMWSWFVGSDIQKQQTHVLNGLVTTFKSKQYNIRQLVKAIVKSEEYRRGFETVQP